MPSRSKMTPERHGLEAAVDRDMDRVRVREARHLREVWQSICLIRLTYLIKQHTDKREAETLEGSNRLTEKTIKLASQRQDAHLPRSFERVLNVDNMRFPWRPLFF